MPSTAVLIRENQASRTRRNRSAVTTDSDAQHRYIHEALDYVAALARSYSRRGMDFDELVAAGNLGLVEAAQRFDPAREVKFMTYADWWIRKTMLEALAANRPVRLPRYQRDKLRTLAASRSRLSLDTAGRPAREDLARESGFSRSEVDKLLQLLQRAVSLDQSPDAGEGRALNETLDDGHTGCPVCTVVNRDLMRDLRAKLSDLSERERAVVALRFGLTGDPLTLREAGEKLGIGRESVRQLEMRALSKLRERLAS